MESLHKHMDPNHLPADYGGKLPKINYTSADWYPEIEKARKHIAGTLPPSTNAQLLSKMQFTSNFTAEKIRKFYNA